MAFNGIKWRFAGGPIVACNGIKWRFAGGPIVAHDCMLAEFYE